MTLYNTIGHLYTRKADSYIANQLYDFLLPTPEGLYLDIGCGTGNYLKALYDKGLNFYGVDPSEVMLEKAKIKNPHATFITAQAENIPLSNHFFDGAIAVLTFHHWTNKIEALKEVNRVLKSNSKLVFFSFTPEQMQGYWLYHYFPKMIENCMKVIPPLKVMKEWLIHSGFTSIQTEEYFVHPGLQDHFLYSHKYSPEKYLLEEVRDQTSGFKVLSEPIELGKGLQSLEKDIESGKIKSIIDQYENNLGDYLFIVATK